MSDITIPPEALEAAKHAWYDNQHKGTDDRMAAAIRAALAAWPGMNTGPNIYGRQDAIIHLPLPQEKTDE